MKTNIKKALAIILSVAAICVVAAAVVILHPAKNAKQEATGTFVSNGVYTAPILLDGESDAGDENMSSTKVKVSANGGYMMLVTAFKKDLLKENSLYYIGYEYLFDERSVDTARDGLAAAATYYNRIVLSLTGGGTATLTAGDLFGEKFEGQGLVVYEIALPNGYGTDSVSLGSLRAYIDEMEYDGTNYVVVGETKGKNYVNVGYVGHNFGEDGYCRVCHCTLSVKYTETAPCIIETAEDLKALSDLKVNDADLTDCYFRQTEDIDISAYDNWQPIGTVGMPFEGVYDGNGYSVEGLNIESAGSYLGLFGFVTGTVKDLEVHGTIIGINEDNLGYAHTFAGGVAGAINNDALISGCVNYVNVTGDSYVGGVVGSVMKTDYLQSGTNFGRVESCVNYGKVTANAATATNEHATYFGGIVGSNYGVIANCTNNGEVDGDTNTPSEATYTDRYVGGIAGYSYIPFKNGAGPNEVMEYTAISGCYNYGYVHGTYGVGGIVGQGTLTIAYCENRSSYAVEGKNCVGGIAGIFGTTGTDYLPTVELKNCLNTGNVKTSERNLGGIVGYNYRTVKDCENSGDLSYVEGKRAYYVGGIVGTNYGEVTTCTNSGNVTSTSATTTFTGGVVGQSMEGSSISDCSNSGDVDGLSNVGGIVGKYQGNTFEDNENSGTVTGTSRVGGVLGLISSEVTVSGCTNGAGATVSGTTHIGGIVGQIEGGTNAAVTDCHNYAAVTSLGEDAASSIHIGGVVGIVGTGTSLTDSSNAGAVSGIGSDSSTGGVGGVVGSSWTNATISNCTNAGAVTATEVAGGVVGYKYGAGTTTYNVNKGTITVSGSYVGGILGVSNGTVGNNVNGEAGKALGAVNGQYAGGIAGNGKGGTLSNNTNYGAVTSGSSRAAGVLAYSEANKVSSVSYCYNYGAVTSNGMYAGGVMAVNYSASITYCVNYGAITATGDRIGGIAGWIASNMVIDHCENAKGASVYSTGAYVGGILGIGGDGSKVDNYFTLTNCTNGGAVEGNGYVGGMIGLAGRKEATSNAASISGNTNNGAVTGNGANAGGIIGYNYCVEIGANENTGAVSGSTYVGGIIGYNLPTTAGSITGCTNSGDISGSGAGVAGIIGYAYQVPAGSNFDFIRCINTGDISSSKGYVGGIVGMQGSRVQLLGCESYCAITGTSSSKSGVGILSGSTFTSSNITSYTSGGNTYACKVCGTVNGVAVSAASQVVGYRGSTTTTLNYEIVTL